MLARMSLYRLHDHPDLVAPSLVAAFDGWVDAGGAASSATAALLEDAELVVSFDPDQLFDYRSRRPSLEIVDGRLAELTWPELAIRRTRLDDRDVLVMSGHEPDDRWRTLCDAVVELAGSLGIAEWISLGAIPAAVPHTRPVNVLGTATHPDLMRGGIEVGPAGIMHVPAAALSALEMAVASAGIPAVGYFAQVPHYVSGPYPAAAVELLRALGHHLDVEPPMGSLPEEARQLRLRLDAATAVDETSRTYVERLEAMVDEARLPSGDDLISQIERFLRDRGGEGSQRP
jgi:proteasome assembly chaperone (PAC2) family protein